MSPRLSCACLGKWGWEYRFTWSWKPVSPPPVQIRPKKSSGEAGVSVSSAKPRKHWAPIQRPCHLVCLLHAIEKRCCYDRFWPITLFCSRWELLLTQENLLPPSEKPVKSLPCWLHPLGWFLSNAIQMRPKGSRMPILDRAFQIISNKGQRQDWSSWLSAQCSFHMCISPGSPEKQMTHEVNHYNGALSLWNQKPVN